MLAGPSRTPTQGGRRSGCLLENPFFSSTLWGAVNNFERKRWRRSVESVNFVLIVLKFTENGKKIPHSSRRHGALIWEAVDCEAMDLFLRFCLSQAVWRHTRFLSTGVVKAWNFTCSSPLVLKLARGAYTRSSAFK